MIEEIEKECERQCEGCNEKECKRNNCVIYRIKKIIEYDDEITTIDIDDFFEKTNKGQLNIFDFEV